MLNLRAELSVKNKGMGTHSSNGSSMMLREEWMTGQRAILRRCMLST